MLSRRPQKPDADKSRARAPLPGSQRTRWGAEPQERVFTSTRESVLMRVGQAQSTRGLDQARQAYCEGLRNSRVTGRLIACAATHNAQNFPAAQPTHQVLSRLRSEQGERGDLT